MKSLGCNSEYHQDCFNQCREEGHTNCLYCRCPMQEGGGRNGGGEDDSESNGGGRGRGREHDGGREGDDVVGENNNGGGDGRGDDEGELSLFAADADIFLVDFYHVNCSVFRNLQTLSPLIVTNF